MATVFHFPDDDRRSARLKPLEIITAEQRILTRADALLTWMVELEWGDDTSTLDAYYRHTTQSNPGSRPLVMHTSEGTVTKTWILDQMDRDANMLFMELLRSAWELRCWRAHYGLTHISPKHPRE